MTIPPTDADDPFHERDPIARVASFMAMCLAGCALDRGLDDIDDLAGGAVAFSYSGNGASDRLTVDDVREFVKAAVGRAMRSEN